MKTVCHSSTAKDSSITATPRHSRCTKIARFSWHAIPRRFCSAHPAPPLSTVNLQVVIASSQSQWGNAEPGQQMIVKRIRMEPRCGWRVRGTSSLVISLLSLGVKLILAGPCTSMTISQMGAIVTKRILIRSRISTLSSIRYPPNTFYGVPAGPVRAP